MHTPWWLRHHMKCPCVSQVSSSAQGETEAHEMDLGEIRLSYVLMLGDVALAPRSTLFDYKCPAVATLRLCRVDTPRIPTKVSIALFLDIPLKLLISVLIVILHVYGNRSVCLHRHSQYHK